ncbi:MAG: ATP-binding protein [bacterium]|nr:ATP-binding protein [bacterium]
MRSPRLPAAIRGRDDLIGARISRHPKRRRCIIGAGSRPESYSLNSLKIFVSSPGDVAEERVLCQRVIKRLQSRFLGRLTIEPVIWEHEPLLATATFQDQIVLPSETDVVVCILWARLGTRLPAHITRADGSRYDSGTEFEFEDAFRAFQETGSPELLVYRKTVEPRMSIEDEAALHEKLRQKKALDGFFAKWFEGGDGSLTAAFSPYQDLAEFEDHMALHLEKLLVRKLVESGDESAAEAPPLWQQGSPYRGLETFEYEHAPVFFGRTRAIHDVLDALRAQAAEGRAFVNILGMSGGGKSSLARAGVLPLLTHSGVIEGVGLWRRAVMRPADRGGDVFAALAAALAAPEALPALAEEPGGVDGLARLLRETPRDELTETLPPRVEAALDRGAADLQAEKQLLAKPVARLILLVDQLEEIFTLEQLDDDGRAAFVDVLDALARSGHAWVLATLRSDFFPRCGELPALVALQERAGQYHLLRPSPAEIGEMIRKPAVAAGLDFDHDPDLDMGLDDVLRDAAADSPEALPLLEFTLEQLYEARSERGVLTFEAYRHLGGVEGARVESRCHPRRSPFVFSDLGSCRGWPEEPRDAVCDQGADFWAHGGVGEAAPQNLLADQVVEGSLTERPPTAGQRR